MEGSQVQGPIPTLLSTLNEKQLETLARFRERYGDRLDDHTLARFLEARKFDDQKATQMIEKLFSWRIEQEVDQIHLFEFPELPQVKQVYPHGFHKTDRYGRPIYIERIGALDLNRLFEITTEERMLKYYIREYEAMIKEKIPACAKAAGFPVEQTLTILDLGGSSMKLMSKKVINFVKIASSVCQDYYPEILGRMFLVNTPTLFSMAWKIIKGFVDKKTQKKIATEGSRYQRKLLELVAPENLPDFLGGTCNCEGGCLNSNAGPWSALPSS